MSYYLIPFCTNSNGLPLEYRLIAKKEDMRFNFCKKNQKYKINILYFFELLGTFQKDIKIKNNRLILLNGKSAYQFKKELKKCCNY